MDNTQAVGPLLADEYALEMMEAAWAASVHRLPVVMELFFRTAPFKGHAAVVAGTEQVADYLTSFRFSEADLDYIGGLGFDPDYVAYLRQGFRFTGSMTAMAEGTLAFGSEPIITLVGPYEELQWFEARVLNIINPQMLIATKALRVVQAAGDDPVLEMGLRRAHGADAAIRHSRAAYIGGVAASSNLEAGRQSGVPVRGTHGHALVMMLGDELAAFRLFAAAQVKRGKPPTFLVDTFDVLRSGLPSAMQVAQEIGLERWAIRIDSGDLAYLPKAARAVLDAAGYPREKVKIAVSGDLDEYLIRELKMQGAPIDLWGVGTNLIVAADQPALGGVYKLTAVMEDGVWEPRIKLSENPAKISIPGGPKRLLRFADGQSGMYIADLMALPDEPLPDPGESYLLFDPVHPWKKKRVRGFKVLELTRPFVAEGARTRAYPTDAEAVAAARARLLEERAKFWPEYLRLVNPEPYPVDLSQALWGLRQRMILEGRHHGAGPDVDGADQKGRGPATQG